ncbi:hypothetical protein IJD44_07760 [bacterium]|nr:hypothetical protein [bacterium]
MMFFIGLIVGGFVVLVLMCAIQVNRTNEALTTVKQCESAMEHERVIAIKEKKSIDYINGMSRAVGLFKAFYEEELR